MRNAAAFVLLALLASCGGAGGASEGTNPGVIEVYEVAVLPVEAGNRFGWTSWDDEATTRIYMRETNPVEMTSLVHELLHGMGLVEHEGDAGCYLRGPDDKGQG